MLEQNYLHLLFLHHHNAAACNFDRVTVQRTQQQSVRSAERSRTPTPSTRTAAVKPHMSPACWPGRSFLLAFHKEVLELGDATILCSNGTLPSPRLMSLCFCRQSRRGRVRGRGVEEGGLQQSAQTEDGLPEREW